ncbi:MAG TPA: D-isomer specific 2-hydroxyacid dehydrogenase family protein [Pseudonocardiaceae bacterium]|nr:D-isomer specific 2-hydroxyacid dehydrogenase family protein [Pseudonocardiaceae bacterium]
MDRTVFVALADVMDDPGARAALEEAFSTVVVATARSDALTELTALGDAVHAAIVGVRERVDARVLEALPQLRVLGSISAGTDHLDLAALADRGVRVITAPGVNAVSVAEHALMMILALAKRALPAHTAVTGGQDRAGVPDLPVELRGRRAGVLGAGATARSLIPLVRALGMEVLVWTRHPRRHPDLRTATLEEIFAGCGVVSVHLPLTPQTRGMVGARLLRLLPPGAFIVNVARKEIIDGDGLRAVVAERPDVRFAIDDFGLAEDGTVAIVGDQGLWSPHIAGVTAQASAAMQDVVIRGVVREITSQRLPSDAAG